MKKIWRKAAGIDIGAKAIFVAIEGSEVKSFSTFTEGFNQAKDYLLENSVETVAMEATGVYWVALHEILQSAGLDIWLVDGKQTKQVPGRKTDVKDSQWIQQLHSYGLLTRCFIPNRDTAILRSYERQRQDNLRSASMHINHMQKALIEMNIRLPEVLSEIHGTSGMAMIGAILNGERNPQRLLDLCHKSIKKNKPEQILKALEGHYTEHSLFSLKQAYNAYLFYQEQMMECEQEMQKYLERQNRFHEDEDSRKNIEASPGKRKPIRHNKPEIDNLPGHLLKIFGQKDPTVLPGITDYTWLQLYTEMGADLRIWPTEKHFTSWMGLAPGQHRSGKMNRKKTKRKTCKAGQLFRQIAQSLLQSKNIALGAFGRKLRAKHGPPIAIKATARKLAVLYWRLMVKGLEYTENGIRAYEEKVLMQKEKWIHKAASELGYKLAYATS